MPNVAYLRYNTDMSEAHSLASKNRWKNIPQKERSERMRNIAKLKWSSMSVEDRKNHSRKMLAGKK